jgi:hypothetical protein
LDTVRRILDEKGSVTAAELAGYAPTPEIQAERDRKRQAFVATLLAPLEQQAESSPPGRAA